MRDVWLIAPIMLVGWVWQFVIMVLAVVTGLWVWHRWLARWHRD